MVEAREEFAQESQEESKGASQQPLANFVGADDSGDDQGDADQELPASSFYSQMPYLSQQMLNGADDANEDEQKVELF